MHGDKQLKISAALFYFSEDPCEIIYSCAENQGEYLITQRTTELSGEPLRIKQECAEIMLKVL
jgi:hypothetical protein